MSVVNMAISFLRLGTVDNTNKDGGKHYACFPSWVNVLSFCNTSLEYLNPESFTVTQIRMHFSRELRKNAIVGDDRHSSSVRDWVLISVCGLQIRAETAKALLAPNSRADPCSSLIQGCPIDHRAYAGFHQARVPEKRPCAQMRAATERNPHFPAAGSSACSEIYPGPEKHPKGVRFSVCESCPMSLGPTICSCIHYKVGRWLVPTLKG